MKQMRRVLALTLVFALLLSVFPTEVLAEVIQTDTESDNKQTTTTVFEEACSGMIEEISVTERVASETPENHVLMSSRNLNRP